MTISIQLPENSVERVDNSVIINLYNAHINGNISDELNENNLNIGLVGSITADGGYESLVSTLTSAYPKFHCSVTKTYLLFEDSNVYTALRNQGIGDSFGISISDLDGLHLDGNGNNGGITFKNNTDIEYFEEFKYFTNCTGGHNAPFANCTNLKLISLPSTYFPAGDGFFLNVHCDVIVPSLKWLMEFKMGRRDAMPSFNNQYDYYIGDRNHKLVDVVVTYDMTPNSSGGRKFQGTSIETVTWESNTNIPGDTFRAASHLSTVTVTGNITSVGYDAFAECRSSLTTVTLPQSCTILDNEAFKVDSSLLTISAPGVISVGSNCFLSADNLVSVDFINNLHTVGAGGFESCERLPIPELNMPNLTSLGQSAFAGCKQLETISNLGNITNLPAGAFGNCLNLRSVILPTSLITAPGGGFVNSKVQKLIYPYGLTSMLDSICYGYTGQYLLYMQFPSTITLLNFSNMYRDSGSSHITCYIVVQATTPPSTGYNSSDTGGLGLGWGWGNPSIARWYVPDSVLNDYKTDPLWSVIADYIFPISLLETDSATNWQLYQNNKNYGVS